jgi:hypothetical protein
LILTLSRESASASTIVPSILFSTHLIRVMMDTIAPEKQDAGAMSVVVKRKAAHGGSLRTSESSP